MSDFIPSERARAAASFICKHSVALLRPDASSPSGVHLVGSGTLIFFRGNRFFLTATHVWQKLRKYDLVYYTKAGDLGHTSAIRRIDLTPFSLDDVPYEDLTPTSPDLTLLELNPVDADVIETRLSFAALSKPFKARQDQFDQEIVAVGAPGVLRKLEGNTLFFEIRAVFADGEIQEETERDLGFITMKPSQDADSPIVDWRGMSGGGLWLISYFPKPSGEIDYEVFLRGVTFFQNGDKLHCHSRKSIATLAKMLPPTKSLKIKAPTKRK